MAQVQTATQTQATDVYTIQPVSSEPLIIPGGGTVPVPVSAVAPTPTVSTPTGNVAAAPTTPSDPAQVDNYLNQFQQTVYNNAPDNSDPFSSSNVAAGMGEIANLVTPTTPKPSLPNLEETARTLRGEYGIDTLTSELNNLKATLRDEQAYTQQRIQSTRRETSRMDAIAGRVSAIEEQQNYRVDELNRSIAYKVDLINSGLSAIDSIMRYKQMDFENASQQWTQEFSQNMQLYQAFQSQMTQEQQAATSNLQIWSNLITSGNLSYDGLTSDQKVELTKLEIKSGLGRGFLSNLQMTPGANIKAINQRTDPVTGMGYADTIYVNPDGSIRVVTTEVGKVALSAKEQLDAKKNEISELTKLQDSLDKKYQTGKYAPKTYSGGGGGTKTKAPTTSQLVADMSNTITKSGILGGDGYMSPSSWKNLLQQWNARGQSTSSFISNFKRYVNPSHYQDYSGIKSSDVGKSGSSGSDITSPSSGSKSFSSPTQSKPSGGGGGGSW